VTPDSLRTKMLIRTRFEVLKILGDGALSKPLQVSAHRFSKSAREKIVQAGGQVIELPGRSPVVRQGKNKKV
jgi:large subunit ribosomal protein L15